jgi:hypothetical protein
MGLSPDAGFYGKIFFTVLSFAHILDTPNIYANCTLKITVRQ